MDSRLMKDLDFGLPRPIDWDAVQRRRKRERENTEQNDAMLQGFLTGATVCAFSPCPSLVPTDEDLLRRVATHVAPLLGNGGGAAVAPTTPQTPDVSTAASNSRNGTAESTSTTVAQQLTTQRPLKQTETSLSSSRAQPTTTAHDDDDGKFDYSKCLDTLRANANKPFADCVSAFGDGQHRQYAPFVQQHLQNTLVNRIPDQEAILDIVAREQTQFLQKWHEYTITSSSSSATSSLHSSDTIGVDAPLNRCYLSKGLLCGSDVLRTLAREIESVVVGDRHHALAPLSTQVVAGEGKQLHPRACLLLASREIGNAPQAAAPPFGASQVLPRLDLSDESAVKTLSVIQSKSYWSEVTSKAKAEGPRGGVTISLDSLVALATTLSLGGDNVQFHTRVSKSVGSDASRATRLIIGDVLLGETTSRSSLLAAEYTAALMNNLSNHSSSSGVAAASRQFEVLLQVPLSVSSTSIRIVATRLLTADISEPLVVPMVKLHHLRKPLDAAVPKALCGMLEEYSKEELVRMHLTLALIPQAQIAVHHVDAFTGQVWSIEMFTPTTFSSSIWTSTDPQCSFAWSKAVTAVQLLFDAATKAELDTESQHTGVLTVAPSGSATLFDHSTSSPWRVALEAVSETNAKRGSLAPALWPLVSRIPFTFPSSGDRSDDQESEEVPILRGKLIGKALLVKKGK